MSRPKKSKAYPIVAVLTILIIALAVVCFLVNPLVIQPQRDALERANQEARAKVEEENRQAEIAYQKALSDYENAKNEPTHPDWPEATVREGFELIDLTNYPLDYQTGKQMYRSELMTGGMLLVNEWHERPADFDQSGVISVKQAYSGDDRIQAKDNLVTLFPNAVEALHEALMAAKEEGHLHYLVEEGYRTVEKQQEYFTNRINKLSSKYEGDALIAAAKKEVNEPGHSEYNTGLAFELRLFDKDDADVAVPK